MKRLSAGQITSLGNGYYSAMPTIVYSGQVSVDFGMENPVYFKGHQFYTWLDGKQYPVKEGSRFGRSQEHYAGWGELRKQKKPPHTEVLYTLCLQSDTSVPEGQILVLRSINNCSNDQLQMAIGLAGVRLESHMITQQNAEFILDKCYAEIQRRLEWTDREKAKRNGKPQINQGEAPVDPSA